MAFRDLLKAATSVSEPISVVHDLRSRSMTLGHPMLLAEAPIEAPGHRVALNVLRRDRLCEGLGIEPSEFIDLLAWGMANPQDTMVTETGPVLSCRMDPVDLTTIPIPWHWQGDAGRYMSASVIIAQDAERRNMSFHRQLLIGPDELVVRLVPRHLHAMVAAARSRGEDLDIAIVNAPDPTVLLAAAMSFDTHLDELEIASALHQRIHGRPLEVVTMSNGIQVPADAEYAMVGRITVEDRSEGPYVDITGTLDDVRQQPLIRIDELHHRDRPVFHALIPGEAEHKTLMGLPRAPTVKQAVSEVCDCLDVHMSEGGCGWLAAVVQIDAKRPEDASNAIQAAFDGHRSMKMVTIVDADIDPTDPVRVEWAMMTRWQPDRDTVLLTEQKGSSLDPSRSEDGTTAKIGIDATIPFGADRSGFTIQG